MAFRPVSRSKVTYPSPEALFNDLKGRKYDGLLSHQADVLRAYQAEGMEKPDVAFQMPTGSGKTLVGLILAEWRRHTRGERVVYLCPTRQLAYQVGNEANEKCGMRVNTLVGEKRSFSPDHVAAYVAGEAIAVTTFSGLFNVSPAFEDPQLIIVDDAHASENYFASYWSVVIDREDTALWRALVAILKNYLHPYDLKRLTSEVIWPADAQWVDKLRTPALFECHRELSSVLDEHLTEGGSYFRWSAIRDHLLACHVYVSATQIVLRPLLAPTDSHAPFAGARQRVFMSATLGQGGDLAGPPDRHDKRSDVYPISVDIAHGSLTLELDGIAPTRHVQTECQPRRIVPKRLGGSWRIIGCRVCI